MGVSNAAMLNYVEITPQGIYNFLCYPNEEPAGKALSDYNDRCRSYYGVLRSISCFSTKND